MTQKLQKYWPIILIAASGFFLRTVKIEDLFYFTYDESIPAFVGRRLLLWHHLPLIGGVTPFGFHLAPYFYWLLATILIAGKLNPLAWGFAGAALSVVTTILIYIVGREFASKKVGVVAAIFWATSYLTNVYDRHFWALWWGPLLSLLTFFSLYKIIKGNNKFTYLLAFTIAFAICADPSNFVFVLLTLVVWVMYKLPVKQLGIIVGISALSFAPLMLFDLRHNFANTKPILNFINAGQNNPGINTQKLVENTLLFPKTFSRLIYTVGDSEISKQYSYCQVYAKGKLASVPPFLTLISSIVLLSFIYWSFAKNREVGWRLSSVLLMLYFVGIQVYGTIFRADIFEHYITGSFAIMLLIAAKVVSNLPQKAIIVLITLFVFLNATKIYSAKNDLGLKVKRQAIEYTMQQVGDRPFSLDSLSTCWKLNGYRFLFTVFGREPVKSYVDPNFSYLYGTTPVWESHPPTVVAFVGHDFIPETEEFNKRYDLLKSHELSSKTFGALEVIIMDNSTNWFDQPPASKNPSLPAGID